jgi:hypothetical protein
MTSDRPPRRRPLPLESASARLGGRVRADVRSGAEGVSVWPAQEHAAVVSALLKLTPSQMQSQFSELSK